jgi:hypothetical protein
MGFAILFRLSGMHTWNTSPPAEAPPRFVAEYEQQGVKIMRDQKTGVRYLILLKGGAPQAITPLIEP